MDRKEQGDHSRLAQEERMKTSVYLEKELWKQVKIEAARRDMKLTEFMKEAIREYLKKGRDQSQSNNMMIVNEK